MLFDEIHQEFDGDEGNDERHDGPQQQSENFRSRESAVLQYELDDFYKTRAEHDGNGEKKGEFRGGGAGDAHEQRAEDGYARTRGAGNQGQHLKRADDQRRLPIDFVRRIDFEDAVFILVFHDDKSDAVEDEHGGDDQRGAYFLIYFVFVENDADDSRGDTGDDHFSPKLKDILLDDGFFLILPLKGKQLFPKQNDDGENGAQLNDDVEHIFESVALSKGTKGVHVNDMPRAGNGKPLRDPFDDAQQNDFEYFCKFHKDPPTSPIFRQKR